MRYPLIVIIIIGTFIMLFLFLGTASAGQHLVSLCGDGNVTGGEKCDHGWPYDPESWCKNGCQIPNTAGECKFFDADIPNEYDIPNQCQQIDGCWQDDDDDGVWVQEFSCDLCPDGGRYLDPTTAHVEKPGCYFFDTMKVPDGYKKEHFLSSDYEQEGLDELKADGKCQDCDGFKNDIVGIITKYDPIEIKIYDPPSGDSVNSMKVIPEMDGELRNDLAKDVPLSSGLDEGLDANVEFKNRWKRGSRVRFKIEVDWKEGYPSSWQVDYPEEYSGYFVVAQYNLFVFQINQTFKQKFKEDYQYFNSLSQINNKINYSAKYITVTNILSIEDFRNYRDKDGTKPYTSAYVYKIPIVNDLQNTYDFINRDRIIFYSNDEDFIKTSGRTDAIGICDFSSITSVFINNDRSRFSTLSHELGHAYSNLADEYRLSYWNGQSNRMGFTNPNIGGQIRFPRCCLKALPYVCYVYSKSADELNKELLIQGSGKVTYSWMTYQDSESLADRGFSFSFTKDQSCIDMAKEPCGSNSFPGKCLMPENPSIAEGICGDEMNCKGMPYHDVSGNDPDDISHFNASSYSIMGHGKEGIPFVYPKNAQCPLRDCPD